MIVGLATAVASHRTESTIDRTPKIAGQYQWILWLMLADGLALGYELAVGWPFENAVAYIEWVAIILFTWCWVAETVRQELLIKIDAEDTRRASR